MTVFQKRLSDIVKDYKSAESGKMSAAFSNIFGYKKSDLSAIEQYNSLIEKGVDQTEAFKTAMSGASEGAQNLVKNSKTATIDIKALSSSERAAAIATEALGVALNVALTLGVSLLIQGIITYINKLANAEKEAAQEAEELRKKATDAAELHKSESDSLSDLVSQYTNLVLTTSNLSDEKEKLLKIQEELNKGISSEKEQIDLLNGSLAENIEKINERNLAEAKSTVRDLGAEYQNALVFLDQESLEFKDRKNLYYTDLIKRVTAILGSDNIQESYNWQGQLSGFIIESGEGIEKNIELMDELLNQYDDYLAGARDTDLYEMFNNEYNVIKKIAESYKEQYEQSLLIKSTFESAEQTISEFGTTQSDRLREIYGTVEQLSSVLSGNGSAAEKFAATQQLKELEVEAYQLAGTNELLRDNVKSVFQAFESGASSSVESVDNLRSAWLESLDEMQKGAISDIDKVKSAMQKLAEGENLDFGTFKELVWGLDEEGILKTIKQVGDTYNLSQEELIRLKDSIINMTKQEVIEEQERTKQIMKTAQMELEVAKVKAKRLSNPQSNSDAVLYREARAEVERLESSIKEYNRILQNDNTLISYLNSQLGNTVNITKVLEAQQKSLNEQISTLKNEVTELTSKADNLLKAQEHRIDQIVDGFESEKEALEADKKLLEDQLATLEEQEETLNNIIKDYESVAKVASNAIQEEVDSLKQQQQAIEDSYNARIDALKEQKEQQEEENSLVEKELSLQEKLRDLEKAKQTKVLTYSSAQGWHYDVDKEVVAQAQSAVDDAQKVYDEAVADKLFNDRVKALEKERDEALSSFEDRIEGLEEYAQLWENISDEIIKAEEEVLAQQLLGSDWREKINNKDISLLTKYRTEYRNYNAQLKTLTNTEIEHMKQSINAKDQEIKAKQEQIDTWNKYKTQVQEAVSEIKAQHEDYIDFLNQVTVDENSDFYQREVNLWNFKEHYKAYMDEIASKNYSIDEATRKLESLTNTMANLSGGYTIDVDVNLNGLIDKLNDVSNRVADAISDAFSRLNGFSDGGTAAYTGAAILHGKPTSAETIFNASQSKELYNMVKTGDFSAMVADRAYQGISSALKSMSFNGNADNSSRVININGLTIKADNPAQFHDQFIKEIGQYWKIKLGESYAQ